jgi:riboflavin synthase alpha subunit
VRSIAVSGTCLTQTTIFTAATSFLSALIAH